MKKKIEGMKQSGWWKDTLDRSDVCSLMKKVLHDFQTFLEKFEKEVCFGLVER